MSEPQYDPPPQYGQPPQYGPPAQYGYSAVPAKPTPVVVAAVLGFLYAALGVLATLGTLIGGVALVSVADLDTSADNPFAELGPDATTGLAVGILVLGVLALVWTILMIWGSVWSLTGRSRVLLLVGGSISIAAMSMATVGALTEPSEGQAVVLAGCLLLLVGAVATVVLLSRQPAATFYAAHRARRGR